MVEKARHEEWSVEELKAPPHAHQERLVKWTKKDTKALME